MVLSGDIWLLMYGIQSLLCDPIRGLDPRLDPEVYIVGYLQRLSRLHRQAVKLSKSLSHSLHV